MNIAMVMFNILNTLSKELTTVPVDEALSFMEFCVFRAAFQTVGAWMMISAQNCMKGSKKE